MTGNVEILKAELYRGISKAGNPYVALDIYFTPTCKKRVLLSDAEAELIALNQSSSK